MLGNLDRAPPSVLTGLRPPRQSAIAIDDFGSGYFLAVLPQTNCRSTKSNSTARSSPPSTEDPRARSDRAPSVIDLAPQPLGLTTVSPKAWKTADIAAVPSPAMDATIAQGPLLQSSRHPPGTPQT